VLRVHLRGIQYEERRADTRSSGRGVWMSLAGKSLRRFCAIGTKGFGRQQSENAVYLTGVFLLIF
jgi:hypothetical protein